MVRSVVLVLAACGASSAPRTQGGDSVTVHTAMAADDDFRPTYDSAELARVLGDERKAIAAAEARSDDDPDSQRDVAVRRRFVASLEVCAANARICPPRLDEPAWTYDVDKGGDPPLDSALRFDLASWQKLAGELHGRACACRTRACVETLGDAIDRLETRPMPDVLADDTAALSIVRARECLSRLAGRIATPRPDATR